MKLFLNAVKWDSVLLLRYGIVTVASVISLIYSGVFLAMDTHGMEKLIAFLIFSDPVMYGFLFTAVMILFEKDARINQVLAITRLTSRQYILSKATAFTLLALACSLLILLSARPEQLHLIWFIPAVVLSSVLFVFVAIIGVSYVRNFNQFILVIPLVLAPVCLPLIDFFNISHSWLFYLIPTQASLLLFKGSVDSIESWQVIYSFVYLIVCIYLTYQWANRVYIHKLLKINRHE